MNYKLIKNVKDDAKLRESFFELARSTFDLDFEPWCQKGHWSDRYLPYAFADGEKIIANASANILDIRLNGRDKKYLQIGTVMTDPDYQNQGLSRKLMQEILKDWEDQCDGIYLYANDSVLDFYPKFGFVKAVEYQACTHLEPFDMKVRKLNMDSPEDRQLLLNSYQHSNPYSSMTFENNPGLLMFYCDQYLREMVYYLEEFKTVAVIEYEEDQLICYDIFSEREYHIKTILSVFAAGQVKNAVLGFTPKALDQFQVTERNVEDETLFVLAEKENIFAERQMMMPLLSHA